MCEPHKNDQQASRWHSKEGQTRCARAVAAGQAGVRQERGGGGKEALTGRGERLGTRGLGSRDTHPSALGGQPQQWGDLETPSQEGSEVAQTVTVVPTV